MTLSNATQSEGPASVLGVTTTGIQDISALLPLLGTDQCERHISDALDGGFCYVAATPLSIFGSLGIVKAGFSVLWASVDVPFFRGPKLMRNAGFEASGMIKQITYASDEDDSVYIAEAKLRTILDQCTVKRSRLYLSWRWLRWNLLMFGSTAGLGALGFTPYVYIILRDTSHRPLSSTWMYPLLRILGSGLTATMIQVILQFRIMIIAHNRIEFSVFHDFFKTMKRTLPQYWDPNVRSEKCLRHLRKHFQERRWDMDQQGPEPPRHSYLRGLTIDGAIGTQCAVKDTQSLIDGELAVGRTLSVLLPLFQVLLAASIVTSVVGYIGCFSLVQNSHSFRGPLFWLVAELLLSFIRIAIWAANPAWDGPPPLLSVSTPGHLTMHGIGWAIDDIMAHDMHALVVGVDVGTESETSAPLGFAFDALRMVRYLTDDLRVPKGHVKKLINEKATTTEISRSLRALATDNSIRRDSPILVYFACSTVVRDVEQHGAEDGHRHDLDLATHDYRASEAELGIIYGELRNLLEDLVTAKGENVTVIIDAQLSASAPCMVGINSQPNPDDEAAPSPSIPASSWCPTRIRNVRLSARSPNASCRNYGIVRRTCIG
ncbi:hypothetical protein DFH06DRAFT_1078727 [Mycena polygramma]|nr:hypothetical protein DFH06DRAFT_1078727 [Mycena polygramma]